MANFPYRIWHSAIAAALLVPAIAAANGHATRVQANTPEELIAAIQAANTSGEPTIIQLAPARFELNTTFDTGFGAGMLPTVTGSIAVVGKGHDATTTLDANGHGRIFTVTATGHLTLRNLTLTQGVNECTGECVLAGGGAIANHGGALRIEDCVLTANHVFPEGGVPANAGGAVVSYDGVLHVINSTITENVALGGGGGIAIINGRASIRHSIISNNRLTSGFGSSGASSGGGLYVAGGAGSEVAIIDSTISGNRAGIDIDEWIGSGGGIFNAGKIWLVNSAVTENGALPFGTGGGIHNIGEIIIVNSTLGGNSGGTSGGALYNKGVAKLEGATLAANDAQGAVIIGGFGMLGFPSSCTMDTPEGCVAGGGGIWNEPPGTVRMVRSLLGLNTARLGPDCAGTVISKGRNAVSNPADCDLQSQSQHADLLSIDPRIADLQDDGDPGDAHFPLLADSPLIDAGGKVSAICTRRDQLGSRRKDGDGDGKVRCDIGAIEFVP